MAPMMTQGLTLMIAGMGTVIIFLSLMVSVMQVTGAFFKKNADRFREQPGPESRVERISSDDSDVVAAVMAALTAYLKK